MTSPTIRPAVEKDLEGISRVFGEADLAHCQALPDIFRASLGTPGYLANALRDRESVLFVAEIEGHIVGAIHAAIRQTPDLPVFVPRRFVRVENVAVSIDRRKGGLGKALMASVHQWASEHGISQMELNVWEWNEDAIRFYESLGYKTARRRMWMTIPL